MATNKKIGNDFEDEFCLILFDAGYWVHRLNQNASGQPADVIAAKDGKAYLIDCKVCSRGGFRLSRIEENQALSMKMWDARGNGTGWFAIQTRDGQIFMLPHEYLEYYEGSSMSDELIKTDAFAINEWLDINDRS